MSTQDIWYFLKGQETVGPFSKEIMQQIHSGGQLLPETLVWRAGMDGWKPASSVAELELSAPPPAAAAAAPAPSKPAQPAAPAAPAAPVSPASPATAGAPGKLKLKSHDASAAPVAAPVNVPAPAIQAKHSPLKLSEVAKPPAGPYKPTSPAPSNPGGPGIAVPQMPPAEGQAEAAGQEAKKKVAPTFLQRSVAYVFSSLFMTPLFLIACGALVFMGRSRFPDVLWLVWIIVGFGVFGVMSILGIRTFDATLRFLAFLFLVPPLVLFWPVIMREVPFETVSIGHWVFLAFCFFLFLTTRIGLNSYITTGGAKFASVTGILLLIFIALITQTDIADQQIRGWKEFVEKGSKLRLPGAWARFIGKPAWGTEVGHVTLGSKEKASRHGMESATLKLKEAKEYRLTFNTLDDRSFYVKITPPEGETFDVEKNIGRELPIFFISHEAGAEPHDDLQGMKWTLVNGQTIEILSATLKIDGTDKEKNIWNGTLSLQLPPDAKGQPVTMPGRFETSVNKL